MISLCYFSHTSACRFKSKSKYYKTKNAMVDIPMTLIKKGLIRIGMLNEQTGTYGLWCHLECWRVPQKLWQALPGEGDPGFNDPAVVDRLLREMNEVLFTGMHELEDGDRMRLVRHVMDKSNRAQMKTKRVGAAPPASPGAEEAPEEGAGAGPSGSTTAPPLPAAAASSGVDIKGLASRVLAAVGGMAGSASEPQAVVPKKAKFQMPKPGQGLAKAGCMDGLTCVMTGIFPEVGGGAGLTLGKDRVKEMVESFGGRVTSAVSGRTNLLIVGKEPGMSKVSKARAQPKCTLIGLKDLADGLAENTVPLAIEKAKATGMTIDPDGFSQGFLHSKGYNSLAYRSSQDQIDFAAGLTAPMPALEGGAEPAAPTKKGKAKAKPRAKSEPKSEPSAAGAGGKRKAEAPAEGSDLSAKKVVELREMLKKEGLSTQGKKAVLVQRLLDAGMGKGNFL